jgi:hypothetical protein
MFLGRRGESSAMARFIGSSDGVRLVSDGRGSDMLTAKAAVHGKKCRLNRVILLNCRGLVGHYDP